MSKNNIFIKKILQINGRLNHKKYLNNKTITAGQILKLTYFETPQFKFLLEKKKHKSNRYFYYNFLKRITLKRKIGICICKRNKYTDGFLILKRTTDNNPIQYFFNFRSVHNLFFEKVKNYYVNFNKLKKSQMLWLNNRKAKKSRIHVD